MQYEGAIYRPPSEAYSLIIQATIGCTHNRCTFCPSYRDKQFRLRPFDAVVDDLREARQFYRHVERIFFADGDAFCMTAEKFARLLDAAHRIFPECSRVGAYSRATQILQKSDEDLIKLREMGLGILYVGAESGSDEVLRRVEKGESAQQIIEAVQKAESAGIKTSVTLISGLGGKALMDEHAVKTGEMISAMNASYVGFLTLLLEPPAPLYFDALSGIFTPLTPFEVMREMEVVFENINCNGQTGRETVFRSNHASNWLVLKGTLPKDKELMLEQIRYAKSNADMFRAQELRRL